MKNSFLLKFLLFFLLSSLSLLFLGALLSDISPFKAKASPTAVAVAPKYTKVIIDAGHGGEDGGASSQAGLVEKEVNLDIAQRLSDMLRMSGVEVIMTRDDDRLLYDRSCDYHGRKKKLDLAARLAVADSNPDAIFISIHMNAFTDPKYSGMQVWYAPRIEGSQTLAQLIQDKNRLSLQSGNTRKIKAANDSIFLLDSATIPSVLIECGFLSNVDEAALFESDDYRQRVAFTIFCAVSEFLYTQEG